LASPLSINALVLQQGGKILVGGQATVNGVSQYVLMQLNPDGSLDPTFGSDGKKYFSFGAGYAAGITALALQPDGKIIAAGYRGHNPNDPNNYFEDIAIARFNPDGAIDPGFGTNGITTTAWLGGGGIRTYSVVVKPNGKILVPGYIQDTLSDFILVQYNSNGTPDTAFGIDGVLRTDLGASDEKSFTALLQPDGKLLVGGHTTIEGRNNEFALVRYLPGAGLHVGTLDFPAGQTQLLVYPNPVKASTMLEYTLVHPTSVTIQLLDLQGRLLQTYINNRYQESGDHQQVIEIPETVPSGQYVLVLSSAEGVVSVRIVR
jgi:uncharacterized delta-60 repeat protein